MKTVLFYSPQCGLRGTEVALYDWADYNEKILGNKSIIAYNEYEAGNHQDGIKKFRNRFKDICPIPVDSSFDSQTISNELEKVIEKFRCTHTFISKGGFQDGILPKNCKTCVLAWAITNPQTDKHGDVYVYASYWLSNYCSNGTIPVIPPMIMLPTHIKDNLRTELNIPENAIVFGRNGGHDTWNIPWSNPVLEQVLITRPDIYFLFQNTPNVPKHDHIIHVPATSDMDFKVKFINTCDAMIHPRMEGESFGISCGEFSLMNKPIITYARSRERNHIDILGDKGIYFNDPTELYTKLVTFKPQPNLDWNCYKLYNDPNHIMSIFNKIFLESKT